MRHLAAIPAAIICMASCGAKTAPQICKEAGQSVVMIKVLTEYGLGSGSGVVIAKDTIVTNKHVAYQAMGMMVIKDDRSFMVDTGSIIFHPKEDLAIIKIPGLGIKPIKMATKDPKQGETVYTIGHPLGLNMFMAVGVFNYRMNIDTMVFSLYTAQISPGNSGGALLNKNGELIGITTASFVKAQNINLAVPYSSVVEFMAFNGIGVK